MMTRPRLPDGPPEKVRLRVRLNEAGGMLLQRFDLESWKRGEGEGALGVGFDLPRKGLLAPFLDVVGLRLQFVLGLARS